uniref:Uncharacterized protein n=1 Tax=Knipowitschia caucasica TaxID=637954 RepID=A0AAV2M7P5_KNICA
MVYIYGVRGSFGLRGVGWGGAWGLTGLEWDWVLWMRGKGWGWGMRASGGRCTLLDASGGVEDFDGGCYVWPLWVGTSFLACCLGWGGGGAFLVWVLGDG